jgi:hypothetical protein
MSRSTDVTRSGPDPLCQLRREKSGLCERLAPSDPDPTQHVPKVLANIEANGELAGHDRHISTARALAAVLRFSPNGAGEVEPAILDIPRTAMYSVAMYTQIRVL